MAAGKLRHPSIPCRTAFRVAVQHEDRARFAPGVGEVVDHIMKIEIWWNAQCGHSACPFRFSNDRCTRTLPPSWRPVQLRSTPVPPMPPLAVGTHGEPLSCYALALHHATWQRAGRLALAVGDLARDDGR